MCDTASRLRARASLFANNNDSLPIYSSSNEDENVFLKMFLVSIYPIALGYESGGVVMN